MFLPPFLLVDDNQTDTRAFIAMVSRIGLINAVQSVCSIDAAKQYLCGNPATRVPLVVFAPEMVVDGEGADLFAWMEEQEPPVSAIPTVMLQKPLEMYSVIGALKALALPERARIDTTTLTVRVELWPQGTVLER